MTRELAHVCPYCGKRQELTTEVRKKGEGPPVEAVPRHGDVSFCLTCGRFSRFAPAKRGGLRRLSVAEADEVARRPLLQEIFAGWLVAKGRLRE